MIRKVRLAAAEVPLQLRFLTIRKVRLAGYILKFMLHWRESVKKE